MQCTTTSGESRPIKDENHKLGEFYQPGEHSVVKIGRTFGGNVIMELPDVSPVVESKKKLSGKPKLTPRIRRAKTNDMTVPAYGNSEKNRDQILGNESPSFAAKRRDADLANSATVMKLERQLARCEKENQWLESERTRLLNQLARMQSDLWSAREAHKLALQQVNLYKQEMEKTTKCYNSYRDAKDAEVQQLALGKARLEARLSRLGPWFVSDDQISSTDLDSMPASPGFGSGTEFFEGMDFETTGSMAQLVAAVMKSGSMSSLDVGQLENFMLLDHRFFQTTPDCSVCVCILADSEQETMLNSFMARYKQTIGAAFADCGVQRCKVVPLTASSVLRKHGCPLQLWLEPREPLYLIAFMNNPSRISTDVLAVIKQYLCPAPEDMITTCLGIFCFPDLAASQLVDSQAEHISALERHSFWAPLMQRLDVRIIDATTVSMNRNQLLEATYTELARYLSLEFQTDAPAVSERLMERVDRLSRWCATPDLNHAQMVHFERLVRHTAGHRLPCSQLFLKVHERLSDHLSISGPSSPLLLTAKPGSGVSCLLADWLKHVDGIYANELLILRHFVHSCRQETTQHSLMLRRFCMQLWEALIQAGSSASAPKLSMEPDLLLAEFIGLLDRVAANYEHGILIVIDGIDRMETPGSAWNWLLDPLPVDVRLVATAHSHAVLPAWRTWNSVEVENVSRAEAQAILGTTSSLYRNSVAARSLLSLRSLRLWSLLSSGNDKLDAAVHKTESSSLDVYCLILKQILQKYPGKLIARMCLLLFCSSNGLSQWQLEEHLLQAGDPNSCSDGRQLQELLSNLLSFELVEYIGGSLHFANQEAYQAIQHFFGIRDNTLRETKLRLIKEWESCSRKSKPLWPSCMEVFQWWSVVPYDPEVMKAYLLEVDNLLGLAQTGHFHIILGLWQQMGRDKTAMIQEYVKHLEDNELSDPLTQVLSLVFLGLLAHQQEFNVNLVLSCFELAMELCQTELDPDTTPLIGFCHHELGTLYMQMEKLAAAETSFCCAIQNYRSSLGPIHWRTAEEMATLLSLYRYQGKSEQAKKLEHEIRSLERSRRAAEQERQVSRRLQKVEQQLTTASSASLRSAGILGQLGVLRLARGDQDKAETLLHRSLEIRQVLLGPTHPDCMQVKHHLAKLYRKRKQWTEAEQLFRELADHAQHLGGRPLQHCGYMRKAADMLRSQGQITEAERVLESLVNRYDGADYNDSPDFRLELGRCYAGLAGLKSLGSPQPAAEPLYVRALSLLEAHPVQWAAVLKSFAKLHFELGNESEAARLYKISLGGGSGGCGSRGLPGFRGLPGSVGVASGSGSVPSITLQPPPRRRHKSNLVPANRSSLLAPISSI